MWIDLLLFQEGIWKMNLMLLFLFEDFYLMLGLMILLVFFTFLFFKVES